MTPKTEHTHTHIHTQALSRNLVQVPSTPLPQPLLLCLLSCPSSLPPTEGSSWGGLSQPLSSGRMQLPLLDSQMSAEFLSEARHCSPFVDEETEDQRDVAT